VVKCNYVHSTYIYNALLFRSIISLSIEQAVNANSMCDVGLKYCHVSW
jgi:hypothetical protein